MEEVKVPAEEVPEKRPHWTSHMGFPTTKEYVNHMNEIGGWGSKDYQEKFQAEKAKKMKK